MTADLTINPSGRYGARMATPLVPTFIPPGPKKAQAFADIPAIARFVHRLRGHRGVQLSRAVATYRGSDTFPILLLSLVYDGEDQTEYAGALCLQGLTREGFERALREAQGDEPADIAGGTLVLA